MRISCVQLSDIHLHETTNWISDKTAHIVGAVRAEEPTVSAEVLLFSGDLVFSGKKTQYAEFARFAGNLRADFQRENGGRTVPSGFVPGNHDCNFDCASDTRAMALSYMPTALSSLDVSGDIVRQCLAVQDDFFAFVSQEQAVATFSTTEKFFSTTTHTFDGFTVRLNFYNTSWLSRRHEKQGELLFPVGIAEPLVAALPPVDLVVSVLHHPYNWLAANNAREFRKLLENSSDLILTGHEHESAIYSKEVLAGPELRYFEGGVLQSTEPGQSAFNVFYLDTSSREYRVVVFAWKSGMYRPTETGQWMPIRRNHALASHLFDNKPEYDKTLHDIGTGFTHPHVKNALRREDLFIYPDLVRRSLQKSDRNASGRLLESKDVLAGIKNANRVVVGGSDLAGKTTMAKSLYSDFKNTFNLVPLLISGRGLSARNDTEVQRVLDCAITEQYGTPATVPLKQLELVRKALIIDDFDECALNIKGQRLFLDVVRKMFGTIIIFADEFFTLEELSQQSEEHRLFHDFECFDIREFGYFLRPKLIEKWVLLGREHSISKVELDQEVRTHENLISSLLGRNLLPSHPLTILTVLQAWEANQSHDTTTGSYGYLYETLILHALASAGFKAADIDVTMTFLSRVAFRMFSQGKDSVTESELTMASVEYFEYYKTRLPENLLSRLASARVLHEDSKEYCFRYPYYFYFFVARYLRDNITKAPRHAELSALIIEMADHVHYERYANVLSFYVYLSKDDQAIAAILNNARKIYEEHPPCDFEGTVAFFNDLYLNKVSKSEVLQLPAGSPETNREDYRRRLDQQDAGEEREVIRQEKLKYDRQLSDVIKINIATKTLQILGQVIRNSPGSLPGDIKKEIATEAYLLGLRSLTAVLSVPANNLESLRLYVMEMIREYRASHNRTPMIGKDLEKMADEGIIHLGQAFAYSMLRRISQSVGLKQLEDIYDEVLSQHSTSVSMRLIDVAIKLDHFADPPSAQITSLDADLKGNHYAHKTLQDLVFGYLYLRDVNYKTRSALMSRFKIQGSSRKLMLDKAGKEKRQ